MTTNLNIAPFYDNFDTNKNFHQILFKPGYSVQARELTQSQSILRDQIAKFGSHVFKHGSVVLPGNTSSDLTVCFVKLSVNPVNIGLLDGGVVVGTSGLRAKIRATSAPTTTDIYATLYVSYYNTGTNGEKVFGDGETLTITNTAGNVTTHITTSDVPACGGAAMAFINDGVFFVNGSFVEVLRQSIVISKYTNIPNCKVLLKITESIVDHTTDETLLDPAQGSYNYAAPGADRLKITLTLTSLDNEVVVGDDYIEVMRFTDGVLESNTRYAKYNELEKSLARRTYDESGDYIANGLKLTLSESIKKQFNGGKLLNGSIDDYAVEVSAGKAYISGFESELISPKVLTAPKGRGSTPNHIKSKSISISPTFGQYLYVTNLKSLPNFGARTVVSLYNSIATDGTAALIGTATVIAIDLHESNSTTQSNIYKLFVTNITSTTDLNTIGSIRYAGGSADVLHKFIVPVAGADFAQNELVTYLTTTATVCKWVRASSTLYVYKHTTAPIPAPGIKITGTTSGANGVIASSVYIQSNPTTSSIIQLPSDATYKVRNNIGTSSVPVYAPNITYTVYKEISITLSGGTGSYTISGGTIDPIDIGNAIVTSTTATLSTSTLSLSGDGLTITYTGAGADGSIIRIICAMTKTNVSNRSKTLVSNVATPDTLLVPSANVTLTKADIYKLVSVISTTDGDVTSRFRLNNGQTDYAYLPGSLVLVGALPTGTLTATYEYFSHSGTGDFFSIDSYAASGLVDYYSTMKSYMSTADKTVYDLRNCLDFRPKFDTTTNTIDMVIVDSRITAAIQYYVPRIDSVVLNKSGEVYVDRGVPNDIPRVPPPIAETVQLGTIFVPAYTYAISDMSVYPSRFKGYKMQDILKLEDRLLNIEQYSLLTQAETALVNNDIIDATTGLSRYKSGYLVETFENPEIIADIQNSEFRASYINNELQPAMESFSIDMEYVSTTGTLSTNPVNKNKTITMPYSDAVFAKQNSSTRVSNINPFAVFSWKGDLNIVPSVDNFVNFNILPPEYETINNVVYESSVVDIPREWAWQPEPGASISFAPVSQVLLDVTGTTNIGDAITQALEWHSAAGDVAGSNDTNPANWWWIP
jgi:Domain of unknown function (DUF4815)